LEQALRWAILQSLESGAQLPDKKTLFSRTQLFSGKNLLSQGSGCCLCAKTCIYYLVYPAAYHKQDQKVNRTYLGVARVAGTRKQRTTP